MYYLVNVDHNGMTVHLTRRPVKGFKKFCISNAVDGTDDDMLWKGSEEDGNVKSVCVCVWRMQELNGKDRQRI